MLREVRSQAYAALANVLKLSGTAGFGQVDDDRVVPVHDLARMARDRGGHRFVYTSSDQPAAGGSQLDLSLRTRAAWDQVQRDGQVTTTQDQMPMATDDLLILAAGVSIAVGPANFDAAAIVVSQGSVTGAELPLYYSETLGQTVGTITPVVPALAGFPYRMPDGKATVGLKQVTAAGTCTFVFTLNVISAPIGALEWP